ncbi:MAG: S41 family peptidase [Woeseiaceae bacterium]
MRNCSFVLICVVLTACSGSNGDDEGPASCSNVDQIRFVRDAMQDWYLWNSLLPNNISARDYASPEDLLADLRSFSPDDGSGSPVDRFSFIGSAAADEAFFAEGQFEGYGFSRAPDARITRVFAGSPADLGGLARGQQILELDGRTVAQIEAAEGLGAALNVSPLTFLMRNSDGSQFSSTITADVVTIDPVPQTRIIAANDGSGRMIGYLEFSTFISTAEPALEQAFADFVANGVSEVILDLRYNGGGLTRISNLLGDYLGGIVPDGDVFSETRFNADRAAANNSIEPFDRLNNSIGISRLVVVATSGTASASELLINSMAPYLDVAIVGDDTFGKPVGQVGFVFCEKILRPTAFQTFNADGFGDYFDGLPATCPAVDNLDVPVGDDTDPNMIAAMSYLNTGQCPVLSQTLKSDDSGSRSARFESPQPPWREYAGAD